MNAKLAVIAVVGMVLLGCSGANQPGVVAAADGDPANGNLAPVGQGQGAVEQQQAPTAQETVPQYQSQAPQAPAYPNQAPVYQNPAPQYQNPAPPPPAYSSGSSDTGYDTSADYSGTDNQVVYADQAPPPLPEYNQPSCPGENYIWTPGSGITGREVITGFRERGFWRPMLGRSGPRPTGSPMSTGIVGIADSGESILGFMAASIMGLAM